jgi:hypothetical protein
MRWSLLTSLLAPWSTVLPDNLTSSQLVKKLWNVWKVHQRIYKSQPPVRTLSQINPVHAPTLPPKGLPLLYPNFTSFLILSFHLRLGLPSGFPSFRIPHQNSVCTSPLPYTCYMTRPSHSSRFDHPNSIW